MLSVHCSSWFCLKRWQDSPPGMACPRNTSRLAPLLILVVVAGLVPRTLAEQPKRIDFNFQIRPLLSDRCFKCHGPDEKARKAKLRLDLREGILKELEDGWAVVKPGNPARSEMVRRIFATDEDDLMPPPKSNLKLAAAEKELLKN